WKASRPATLVPVYAVTIYLSLRLPAEHIPPPLLRAPAPLLVRPIVAARAVAEYAGLVLLPINLHMDREVETQPEGEAEARADNAAWRELQTVLGLLLAGGAAFWMWRSRKQPVFGCLLLAILAYLPVSGIFPLNATVAEHWIYVPTAFLFLAAGLAISQFSISTAILGSVL